MRPLVVEDRFIDAGTEKAMEGERYAIYFAPADDSLLGIFGAAILRRKASTAEPHINPELPYNFDNTELWLACIKKPSHYGFHATLKAPFSLAAGQTAESMLKQVKEFCAVQKPLLLKGLEPRRTRRFDALAFEQQPDGVHHLANSCVEHFDRFRAPLTESELQHRHRDKLSKQQIDYLNRYGYPYVFDQFNFHMTLSGTQTDEQHGWLQWLRTIYPIMVTDTPVLDRLSVFYQPDRKTPFTRIAEYRFEG